MGQAQPYRAKAQYNRRPRSPDKTIQAQPQMGQNVHPYEFPKGPLNYMVVNLKSNAIFSLTFET